MCFAFLFCFSTVNNGGGIPRNGISIVYSAASINYFSFQQSIIRSKKLRLQPLWNEAKKYVVILYFSVFVQSCNKISFFLSNIMVNIIPQMLQGKKVNESGFVSFVFWPWIRTKKKNQNQNNS